MWRLAPFGLFLLCVASAESKPGNRLEEPYPWSSHPLETVIHSRTEDEFNKTMEFCSRRLDPEKYSRVVKSLGTVARFLDARRGWSDPVEDRAAVHGLTLRELVIRAERAERTGVLRLPSAKSLNYPVSLRPSSA